MSVSLSVSVYLASVCVRGSVSVCVTTRKSACPCLLVYRLQARIQDLARLFLRCLFTMFYGTYPNFAHPREK